MDFRIYIPLMAAMLGVASGRGLHLKIGQLFEFVTRASAEESKSNKSISLSQTIKIIGKYISLCNSFALSPIEFVFDKKGSLGQQASTTYLIVMVTRLPWQPEETLITPLS